MGATLTTFSILLEVINFILWLAQYTRAAL